MWSVSSEKTSRFHVRPVSNRGRQALWLAGGSVVALFAAPLFGLVPGVRLVAVPLLFTVALAVAIAGGVLALISIMEEAEGVFEDRRSQGDHGVEDAKLGLAEVARAARPRTRRGVVDVSGAALAVSRMDSAGIIAGGRLAASTAAALS